MKFEDIMDYQKIIVALSEIGRLMKEIDKIEIEAQRRGRASIRITLVGISPFSDRLRDYIIPSLSDVLHSGNPRRIISGNPVPI